ncbi:RimJ/RimL family protein N-acetyltransferase [Cellulomonas sp. SLBN-39]|nr:RimJ/RimL family protein N-acetyltransferase [Cellulomonas sp. SLBN-39]
MQLARFVPEDVDDVHAFASDPVVCEHTTWGPNTPDDTRAFVEQACRPEPGTVLLAIVRDGHVIGSASVWTTSRSDRCGEMGYVLHRDHWGRGYATLVARALLRIGFDDLGLARVAATCAPANTASVRVLEKAGLQHEGHLRGDRLVRGARRDSLVLARLATDG